MRHLGRRTFLRGAAGGAAVSVALPTLEAMLNGNGTAFAGGQALPKRLGIFFWGNGVRHKFWNPKETGKGWALSEELAPLEPVKSYINLVSGTEVKTGNEQGHHAGSVGILSGCPMISQPHPTSAYASTFSGPSIDQVAADVIGKRSRFRSLEVGVSPKVTDNEGTTLLYLSHRGPDNPNPTEYDPAAVFERLFGAGLAREQQGKSVLDAVAEDARALSQRVGTKDRRRIDQHLQNIREIEQRVAHEWKRPARCQVGAFPGTFPAADGKEPLEQMNAAMSRMVTLALTCDQTRVFSYQFSGSVANTVYWQVGEDKPHHQFTHDEPGDQPIVHQGTIFVMKQLCRLLQDLKDTPDGAGNLLDSIAILASSDTADGKEHTLQDYPIVVAGRAGGALKYPGVHYRSETKENSSKVLLSILRSVGLRLPAFGMKGGHVEDSLGAIEA